MLLADLVVRRFRQLHVIQEVLEGLLFHVHLSAQLAPTKKFSTNPVRLCSNAVVLTIGP